MLVVLYEHVQPSYIAGVGVDMIGIRNLLLAWSRFCKHVVERVVIQGTYSLKGRLLLVQKVVYLISTAGAAWICPASNAVSRGNEHQAGPEKCQERLTAANLR